MVFFLFFFEGVYIYMYILYSANDTFFLFDLIYSAFTNIIHKKSTRKNKHKVNRNNYTFQNASRQEYRDKKPKKFMLIIPRIAQKASRDKYKTTE